MEKQPKGDQMILRVNMDERVKIVDAAMERNTTLSQLIRDAVDFYVAFPVALIDQLKKATADIKMDIYDIIPRLLLVYVASDAAILKNFGVSKTFERAFRFDLDGKLLEGSNLSDKTFEEVDKVCKKFLKKLIRTSETGEDSVLTKEEATLFPMVDRGVKPEAKYTPVARAKAAKP